MKWHKPYMIGMAVGIAVSRISGCVFRPFDEACERALDGWLKREPPRDCGGLLWYDYEYNVWTNASGWYCAIGGQCPDSSPDEGDTGKKEDGK